MDKWISVKDRLPGKPDDVLIYIGYPWTETGIGFYSNTGDWWYGDDRDCLVSETTHWMPLPAPPEDK